MTTPLFALVLLAALLHAGWNALLKIGLNRFLTASLIQIGAGACSRSWCSAAISRSSA